jgi:hypothetical protein
MSNNEMTPEQEQTYNKFKIFEWEFDYWDKDRVVMVKWDRITESSIRVAEVFISPDGSENIIELISY